LICDEDLLAALAAGRVAAIGLDVFEREPAIDPRYLTLKTRGAESRDRLNACPCYEQRSAICSDER
jgi:lactate dehydrogenase-like 2-hydroxyacid dehydrogenase